MGIHQPIDRLAESEKLRRDGPLLRSNFLDAFARLETAVVAYLLRVDVKCCATAPFGQKLAALRANRDSFQKPTALDKWIEEIAALSALRADVVHSVLEVAQVRDSDDTRWLFMFRNSGDPERPALLLSIEAWRQTTGRMKTIAHQFSQQQLKAPAPAVRASASE